MHRQAGVIQRQRKLEPETNAAYGTSRPPLVQSLRLREHPLQLIIDQTQAHPRLVGSSSCAEP